MNSISGFLALSLGFFSSLLMAQVVEDSTRTKNLMQYDELEAVQAYVLAREISASMLPICSDLSKPYVGAEFESAQVKVDSGTKWGHTVHKIDPQGAIFKSGVKPGDLLLSINDSEILLSDKRFNTFDTAPLEKAAQTRDSIKLKFMTPDGKNETTVQVKVNQDCGLIFSIARFHGRYGVQHEPRSVVFMPIEYLRAEPQVTRAIFAYELALFALKKELKQATSVIGSASTNLKIMRAVPGTGQLANALADARRAAPKLPFDVESRSKADALAIAILHKMGHSVDSYAESIATAKNLICGSFCFDTGEQGNYDVSNLRSERIAAYVKAVNDSDYLALIKTAGFQYPEKVVIAIGGKQALANQKEGETAVDTKAHTSFSLSDSARQQFEEWKTRANPKAFAISSDGQYGWAAGPRNALLGSDDHPKNRAMKNCQSRTKETCKFYAIDDQLMKD